MPSRTMNTVIRHHNVVSTGRYQVKINFEVRMSYERHQTLGIHIDGHCVCQVCVKDRERWSSETLNPQSTRNKAAGVAVKMRPVTFFSKLTARGAIIKLLSASPCLPVVHLTSRLPSAARPALHRVHTWNLGQSLLKITIRTKSHSAS